MLTFDDGITAALYNQYYSHLFIDNLYNLTNPSGCKINTAMYTINENTDYSKLELLAAAGNEIASHTIHHILAQGDTPGDYGNISAEITGMREVILDKTGNQPLASSLVGFRAPYLRIAGDVMFQVLRDSHFIYDTSIVNVETSVGRPPLWPFTLDYPVKSCVNPPCPTQSYPGLWEVPLNGWVGDDGFGCAMIDACNVGVNGVFQATEQEWYNYYERNFQDHFYKSKVPMHMFTHAALFIRSPGSFQALVRWIQDTRRAHNDVWFVSPKQVIQWMKQPKVNADMITNKWGCNGV
jgi:peptidoglycan/xylan/chitin deacetylase (PgdA/CDA1 family)